jgi:hypothetical protein
MKVLFLTSVDWATTPLTRILIEHLVAFNREIVGMSKDEAHRSFLTAVELLAAAFSRQAGLSGNARAAVRAAVHGQVRRYVENNLHDPDLSPDSVLASLHLSRASVYRLFEQRRLGRLYPQPQAANGGR